MASAAVIVTQAPCRVTLVIDVGSSSLRCSAFEHVPAAGGTATTASGAAHVLQYVQCASSRVNTAPDAATGWFKPDSIVSGVDTIVTECLSRLQHHAQGKCRCTPDNEDLVYRQAQVVAVGFACIIMNWLGVDKAGKAITPLLSVT